MMTINFEFRKGIFFIRLIGELNKELSISNEKEIIDLITNNKFKYIVINTNYLKTIDISGINYLLKVYNLIEKNNCNLIICDKFKIIRNLLNKNIPNIENEIEVL